MLLRTAVLSLVVATALVPATSFAAPNTGKFQRSIEGQKLATLNALCKGLKNDLDHAEAEADKRSETPAAERWSKLADMVWEDARVAGCKWAQD
ncbi:MAG: hypothetical protein ACO1OG_05320 [Devosia sp.]